MFAYSILQYIKIAKFCSIIRLLLFHFQLHKKENFVDIINSPNVRKKQRKQKKKKHYDKNEQNFWIIKIEKSINSVIKGRDEKEMKENAIKLMHEIRRIWSHDIWKCICLCA